MSRKAVIVDPAWELEKIECRLKELRVQLEGILLTHSHFDHTNLVNPLLQRYDVKVYMSKKEIEFYHFHCDKLVAVKDHDIIKLGTTDIICIETPGHTAGSMCYQTRNHLFTGDTVFVEGCGMCVGAGASVIDMYNSLQKIRGIVNESTYIFPSHSYGIIPGCSFETVLKKNIYFHLEDIEDFIEFRMRKNQRKLFSFK